LPPQPAVGGYSLLGVTSSSAEFSWLDRSVNEEGFVIERRILGSEQSEELGSLTYNTTSYRDNTAVAGTDYEYRAVAFNDFGSSEGEWFQITTDASGGDYTGIAMQSEKVYYFLFDAPSRVERFNMGEGEWMPPVPLDFSASALWVERGEIYLARGSDILKVEGDGSSNVVTTVLFEIEDIFITRGILVASTTSIEDQMQSYLLDEMRIGSRGFPPLPIASFAVAEDGDVYGRTGRNSSGALYEVRLSNSGAFREFRRGSFGTAHPQNTERIFVNPSGSRLIGDMGTIYSTNSLDIVDNISGDITDMAFDHVNDPVVLRGATVVGYDRDFDRNREVDLGDPALRIGIDQRTVWAFFSDPTDVHGIRTTSFPTARVRPLTNSEPPVIVGARDLVANVGPGEVALLDFSHVIAQDDLDGVLPVEFTPPASTFFGVGTHEIQASVTDSSNNTTTDSFSVIVLAIDPQGGDRMVELATMRKDGAPGGKIPGSDIPPGSTFHVFNRAVLNGDGKLLIEAVLLDPDQKRTSVLYSDSNPRGELEPMAVSLGATPVEDGDLGDFWNLLLNDAGIASFQAKTNGGESQYLASAVIAATNTAAPEAGAAMFKHLHKPALDAAGELYTPAHLALDDSDQSPVDAEADTGLWGSSGGLIVREGDDSPLPERKFGHLFSRVVTSGDGTIAFAGNLSPSPGAAVFVGKIGNLQARVQRGDPAPGTDGGVFASFQSESISSDGHVAIRATIMSPDGTIDPASNGGLWTNRNGSLELIVREGAAAPIVGAGIGTGFGRFDDVSIVAGGTIWFRAYLRGDGVTSANDGTLWRSTPDGRLNLIAREGDPANNTAANYAHLGSLTVSDGGAAAFAARLDDSDVQGEGGTAQFGTGIWIQGSNDKAPRLALRRGDQFPLAPGDWRAITALAIDTNANPYGGTGGYGRQLNDSEELLVRISVTGNSSGVALVSIPELEQQQEARHALPSIQKGDAKSSGLKTQIGKVNLVKPKAPAAAGLAKQEKVLRATPVLKATPVRKATPAKKQNPAAQKKDVPRATPVFKSTPKLKQNPEVKNKAVPKATPLFKARSESRLKFELFEPATQPTPRRRFLIAQ